MHTIIKNNHDFKFSFLKNSRELICILTMLLFIGYKTNAQSVSYNLNSIPITGTNNTAFGFETLLSNTTGLGTFNTANGYRALKSNTTGNNNTAIGSNALAANTIGHSNVAIGSGAHPGNGRLNTAVGVYALQSSNNSIGSTAVGYQSLNNNTTGIFNTSIGMFSLAANITGSNNTAIGYGASTASGALTNATAIGFGALVNNSNSIQLGDANLTTVYAGTGTTATLITGGLQITGGTLAAGNVLTSDAFGVATWQAPAGGGGTGWSLTGNAGTIDGTNFIGTTDNVPFNIRVNNKQAGRIDPFLFNTFYGQEAGLNNTFGYQNVANGFHSLFSNTKGYGNTAMGYEALAYNTLGIASTAIGDGALRYNTEGNQNTAIGLYNLEFNQTGRGNTSVGLSGNQGNITGNWNSSIGFQSLFDNRTGNENSTLGYYAFGYNIFGDNNVGIGSHANPTAFNFSNSGAIGAYSLVNTSNKIRLGDAIVTEVEGPTYNTISDGRFKNNISEEDVVGLEFIKRLRPVVYNFDTRKFTEFLTANMPDSVSSKYFEDKNFAPSTAIRQSGFIAQEVEVAAAAVGYDFNGLHIPQTKDDNYSLAYAQFVVPLVKAVQELSTQNTSLKQAIDEQAKTNEALKKDMAELRALVMANKNIEGSIKITDASNEAKLFQNAPNPFNKATTIRYTIPSTATKAAITITSLEGKKIKTFELNSKNGQSLDINGGQLSAGTYVYSLMVDDVLIDSKTMILTK